MKKTLAIHLLPALIGIAFASSAGASGFALQNQNGAGTGNAFAGAAAVAEDASTVFFNPAGMTYLPEGHSITVAGSLLDRKVRFANDGSVSNSGAAPLVTTANGGDAGGMSLVPNGYWSYALTKDLRVGVGLSATFGNKTEYDFDFVGRNAGYFAEIKQINLNPSVAYRVGDAVSLGIGINYAHNTTHFRQGWPFTVGPLAAANDFVDLKGSADAWGYNIGAMFQLTPATRLGLAYRSELKFDLEGTYTPNVPVNLLSALIYHDVKAVLKTPSNLSIALSHKLNDKWELLADATQTRWGVINNLDVFDKGSGAFVTRLSYNFKDTWRYGLGANYQYTDQLKLRFGLAYDESPVKSAEDRTMTLPDSDRTWLSVGARWQLSKATSVDVGYSHLFLKDATANRAVATSTGTLLQTVRGKWNNSVDILSLQYNVSF